MFNRLSSKAVSEKLGIAADYVFETFFIGFTCNKMSSKAYSVKLVINSEYDSETILFLIYVQ